MKNILPYLTLVLVFAFGSATYGQTNTEPEALDLPGDNLNLYAVLDVFQKSKTLEDFEKAINDEEGKINNLDLNNDNIIDYIQVVSEKKGDSFFVVLQVAVSSSEKQDVAVVEVTKDKKGQVLVQIIGDEELYGKNYVVEPAEVAKVSGTPNPGYKGEGTVIINNNTTNNYNTNSGTTVSAWPVVIYMFSPLFIPWHSPWYWGYYPPYWRPWRPVYYHSYWGYHSHYYGNNYYHRTVIVRNPGHAMYYSNRRTTSVVVRNNRVNGNYRATYDGRTYRKPASPAVRPGNVNRPSENRPTSRPSTRPSTRPTMPVGNSASRPSTRPTNKLPSTNPVSPSVRPSTPSARPSTRPSTRPTTMPATRPASGNKAGNRGGRN